MAGCALPDCVSRLKWGRAMVKEVIQDGKDYGYLHNRCFKSNRRSIRFFTEPNSKGSSHLSSSTKKRRGVPADAAYKLEENRNALKQSVAMIVSRVNVELAIDSYRYVQVLQECFKQKDIESVKQLHDCIKKSGVEQNPYVASSLLKCYIGCGTLQSAGELFTKLKNKNIVTWNAMITGYAEHNQAEAAIEVYKQLRDEGGKPNAVTYLAALKACATPKCLKWGKDIHAHIIQDGLQEDVRVGTALVRMYAKCGSIKDAREVFDMIEGRNIISWNAMIGGLAQHGYGEEAFNLFHQMQREGIEPDVATYLSILSPNASEGALEWVKELHSHASRSRLNADLRVACALVQMYAMCGSIKDARGVFDRMDKRDLICWNVMIGGLARHGLGQEAFSLFMEMEREGFIPDSYTYVNILNPCSGAGALAWVKEVHAHATKAGLDVDLIVGNALIQMYVKSGSIQDAKAVFDRMEDRDVISWNAVIGGLAQHGLGHEAYSFFLQMQREGLIPDSFTYASILNTCSSTGALEWVKKVHTHAMRANLDVDLRVGNALIQMFAKSGSIQDAKAVLDRMEERDVMSWNAMIDGLAQHGRGHEAFSLFLQMQREGILPNATTYLSILNPCASIGALDWVNMVHGDAVRAGLDVDLRVGKALFHMYAKIGSIADARGIVNKMMTQGLMSWKGLIDGLAQHGHGREALQVFEEVNEKGVKPGGSMIGAVLSACSHANLVDEGRFLFASITQTYCIEPTLEHYACMVELFGRAGHLEEAKLLILNMPIKPAKETWCALLDDCRVYNYIKLADLAAKECLTLEPTVSNVVLPNHHVTSGNRAFVEA